jgi:hypothetical protein
MRPEIFKKRGSYRFRSLVNYQTYPNFDNTHLPPRPYLDFFSILELELNVLCNGNFTNILRETLYSLLQFLHTLSIIHIELLT